MPSTRLVTLSCLAFFSIAASAQTDGSTPKYANGISEIEKHIVCSLRSRVTMEQDGKVFDEQVANGKSSEATVKSWKDGDVEYAWAQGDTYFDGKLKAFYRSFRKTTSVVNGNQTVETTEMEIVRQTLPGSKIRFSEGNGRFSQKSITSVETWENLGNGQRKLVSSVTDGKESPAGMIETTYKVSPNKEIQIVTAPKSREEDGNLVINSDVYDTVCEIETKQ